MKTLLFALLAAGLVVSAASTTSAQMSVPGIGPRLSGELDLGYYGGLGFHASGMIDNFAQGFPLAFRVGIGYASVEPGKAADARRIFINDATNGAPEKSGRMWDYRFDLLLPVKVLQMKQAYLYGGPRYTRFTGNFKYVGGNEDFDVTSNQWGFGVGVVSFFPMTTTLDLALTAGIDYYGDAKLTGHDTSYSPDGDDANPRNDYTYDDADEAIEQPQVEPRVMLGIRYRF